MKTSRSNHMSISVLAVSGVVGQSHTGALHAELLAAVNGRGADVVLDARRVVAFADHTLMALTAARSRAEQQSRRIAVVDRDAGALAVLLRRSGLYSRFPVYPDIAAAAGGLVAARAWRMPDSVT